MIIIDWVAVVGFASILLLAIAIIIKDGFTINRLRGEKDDWRQKYVDQCSVRMDEVKQDAERKEKLAARFNVEYAELEAQCKAAGIAAEGWRKAAENGRVGK